MVKTTEFNVQTQMNYIVGNMSGFTAAYTGMDNLSALLSSLMTSYTTMAGTGRAAYLSLGAAISAVGLKSAEAFGEYQRGMNMVKAISNNTNAQMQMLSQSAQQFSGQFRMGIEDINDGLVTLGRAGLTDVNNQIEVLKNGLQVAKISGMDLASTLEDIVTTTSLLGGDIKSNTFGAETKEVSNLLVATSLSGPLNVSDVIETLKFAGGSAAAAGATLSNEEGLHDLLGTIGAFSQKGVTGSIAGTALRAFITKPASQDQKVSDALAKLGLDAYSLWEKDPEQGWHMKPIAEQIGMITKAMNDNHLTNLDRIEVWGDIVGNKMGQQMLKLDENRIKETTKDIEHQRNLEDIYQGTLTNFASQVERLNQIFQAIYRNVGSGFASMLTGIVQGFADVLEFINSIGNGVLFKAIAPILGPLGLYGLAKGLKDFVELLGMLKANIQSSLERPIKGQALYQPYEDWETSRRGGDGGFYSFQKTSSSTYTPSFKPNDGRSVTSNVAEIRKQAANISRRLNETHVKHIDNYDPELYEEIEAKRQKIRAAYDSSYYFQGNPFSSTSPYAIGLDDASQYTEKELKALTKYEGFQRGATYIGRTLYQSGQLIDEATTGFTSEALDSFSRAMKLTDGQRITLLNVAASLPTKMKEWYGKSIPMTAEDGSYGINPEYAEKMVQLLVKRVLSTIFTNEFGEIYKDFGEFTDKGMNKAAFKEYTNIPIRNVESANERGEYESAEDYEAAKAEAYKIKGSMEAIGPFNFLSGIVSNPEVLIEAQKAAARGLESFTFEGELQKKTEQELKQTEANIRAMIPYLEQAARDAGFKSVQAYLKAMGIASPGTEAEETKTEQERIKQSYLDSIPSVSAAAARLARASVQAYEDFLVFDVETTGLDFSGEHGLKGNDAIIQIGAAHFIGDNIDSSFKTGTSVNNAKIVDHDVTPVNFALINRQVDGTENTMSYGAQQAHGLDYDELVAEGGVLIDEAAGLREFVTYIENILGKTIDQAIEAGDSIKALAHNGSFDMEALAATIERVNMQLDEMGRSDKRIPEFTKVLDLTDTMALGKSILKSQYGFLPIQGLGPEELMSLGYLFTQSFNGTNLTKFMGNEKLETYGWLTGVASKEFHDSMLDSVLAGQVALALLNGQLPDITPVYGANIDAERDFASYDYFSELYGDDYQYIPAGVFQIFDLLERGNPEAFKHFLELRNNKFSTAKQIEMESKKAAPYTEEELELMKVHDAGTKAVKSSQSVYDDQTYSGDISNKDRHAQYISNRVDLLKTLLEKEKISTKIEKLQKGLNNSKLNLDNIEYILNDAIPGVFDTGLDELIGGFKALDKHFAYDDNGNVLFGTKEQLIEKGLNPEILKLRQALRFYYTGKDFGGVLPDLISKGLENLESQITNVRDKEILPSSSHLPSNHDVHNALLRLLSPQDDILGDINRNANTEIISDKVRNYESTWTDDDVDEIVKSLVLQKNGKVVGLKDLGEEFSKQYLKNRKLPSLIAIKSKVRELLKKKDLDKKYLGGKTFPGQEANAGYYFDAFANKIRLLDEDELPDEELLHTRFKEGNMVERIIDGEFEHLGTVEKMVKFVNDSAGMEVWSLEQIDDDKVRLKYNHINDTYKNAEIAAQSLKKMEENFKKANPEGLYYNFYDVQDESFKTIADIPIYKKAMAEYERFTGEKWAIDEDLQWVSVRDKLRQMQHTSGGRTRIRDLKNRAVAGWHNPDLSRGIKIGKAVQIAQENALNPEANIRNIMGVIVDSSGEIIGFVDDIDQIPNKTEPKTKLEKGKKPKKTIAERLNRKEINQEAELKTINKFKQDLNTALENKDLSNIMDLYHRAGSLEATTKKAYNVRTPDSVIEMIRSIEEMTITVENLYNEAENQQNYNARNKLFKINKILDSMYQRIENEIAQSQSFINDDRNQVKPEGVERNQANINMMKEELNRARNKFYETSGLLEEIIEEEQEEVIKKKTKNSSKKKTNPKSYTYTFYPMDFEPMQWASIRHQDEINKMLSSPAYKEIERTFSTIKGVGEKSVRKLYMEFQTLDTVLGASYEQIHNAINDKRISNLISREISRINSSQQDYINLPTQKTKTAEQFLNERKLKANIMPLTPTEAKKQLDRLSNVTFVNLTRDANAELRKKLFGDIFEQPVHEPELKVKKRIVSAPISDPSRDLRMKIFGDVFRNAGKNITKSQISPEQKLQQRNQRAIEKWTQELIKGSMTQEQYAALLEGLTLSGQNFEVELQKANANLLKFSNELLTGTFEDDAARDELRGKIQQEIATIETLNEAKRRETTASIAAAEADRQESVTGRLSGFASAVGGMAGKLANGMFGLMMNPYVMVAQMVWGYVQQGIEMIRQQEEEKISKLSEIASNAESSYDEQTSKWEEAQSKANEKFGDLSDNEKQDQMLEAIQKAREDNNSASAETKALLGKQNALISSSDNMINAKMNQGLTGYKGVQANWEEFMQGSGMVGSKDEFGLMDYLEGLINPDKFKDDSNTARIQAMADATIQIDTRVKNMEEMTEDYQKVMASFGVAGRSMLDIYNVRGILSDDFFSGTFFDPNSSQRIGAPGFRSAEQLAMLMKKEEKILQRFENRYLRFARTSTSQGDRITVTLGEGSIHNLANQLGVKDVEAAQMLAVHELQRIQDVMLNQVEPELAQTAISMYQGAYTLEQNKNLNDVQAAFQNTMTQGIFAIQAQVAQLVYKATMEQALSDYQAATGDTETDTIGLLLNRARDTSYEYHDQAKQFASQGWGGFMQARDLNHLVNQGYTQEEAMNKLLEQGKDGDYYKKLYGEQLGKYEYNGNNFGMEVFKFLSPLLGNELEGYLNYNNYDEFSKYTDWMMKSYAGEVPLDQAIKTLNDAQTAADEEGNNGKDTDTSDADKQRYVQLAICNKKAIPKLNVNLFKKAPTFTVLNKNFKLRDIKINTADKAKNIENSLKNAIIDVQERSDPKIIQDSEAEYDPVGATDDATNLPTGASLTK